MHVIIPVLSTRTVVFTQRITYRIIRRWDAVDQSFFQEGLEGAVYGDPIELLSGPLLDVTMRQRTILLKE